MLVTRSNLKVLARRGTEAAKILTVLGVIVYSAGVPQAAQAQSIGSDINQGLSILNSLNGATGSAGNRRGMLPPTNMDSFVYQAGGAADMIYGDESTGLPPLFGFTQASRINTGIFGQRDAGLTTGHGSFMPDAWGADEFHGNEWNYSGSASGNQLPIRATQLDAADLLESAIGTGVNLFSNFVDDANAAANAINAGSQDAGAAAGNSMGPSMDGGATGGNMGSSSGM